MKEPKALLSSKNGAVLNTGPEACLLARELGIALVEPDAAEAIGLLLSYSAEGLALVSPAAPRQVPLRVDFASGKARHRRVYGGGKGQMIAKACGVSAKFKPTVLDLTAGLGGDGFVLASLGCTVQLCERNPLAFALVRDALARALGVEAELDEVMSRMSLRWVDSRSIMAELEYQPNKPGVIYIDPMFPERKKSAKVKKEMQYFHDLIGADADQDELLEKARDKAEYRVVVKRPKIAEPIAGMKPSLQIVGKSSRYDIYTNKKMPS